MHLLIQRGVVNGGVSVLLLVPPLANLHIFYNEPKINFNIYFNHNHATDATVPSRVTIRNEVIAITATATTTTVRGVVK